MRSTILVWSTVSGLVLGSLCGLALLVLFVLLAGLAPADARWVARLRVPALVLTLGLLPALGGILGYLEGRAKLL